MEEIPHKQEKRRKENSNLTVFSVATFILLAIGVIAVLYNQNQKLKGMLADYQNSTPTPISTQVPIATPLESPEATVSAKTASPSAKACTLEARICPDGSSVGRVGPNCEFAPCPTP